MSKDLNMMGVSYPDGIDCVWVAVDHEGHLGAFVTGGTGPIPYLVLISKIIAIEDIEGRICELPHISDARLFVSIPRPDDFIAMAERGFFVYDWSDVHRTAYESVHMYELMAAPVKPITIDALPPDILKYLERIKLNGVDYMNMKYVEVQAHLDCILPI